MKQESPFAWHPSRHHFGLVTSLFLVTAVLAAACSGDGVTSPTAVKPGEAEITSILTRLSSAGKDANQVWASLSPEAKVAVRSALDVRDVKESFEVRSEVTDTNRKEVSDTNRTSSLTQAKTCKYVRGKRYYTNIFGQTLWAYFERIDWCYSANKILSKSRTRWGEVYAPFWAFAGHTGSTESGGVGSTSYRSWTQGRFNLCMPYVLCAQNKYPWLDITVYGTGSYSGSQGG
jgi:hypothetical protein